MQGLLRLRLEQCDEVEGVIERTLAQRRAAKAKAEAALAHDLQEILLGAQGIAFRAGPGGGVVDTTQLRRNRAARAKAVARVNQVFYGELQPQLLPASARAPKAALGGAS